MTDPLVAVVSSAIGAIAGLSGGFVAALSTLRSSQIAARVSVAQKIHALVRTLPKLAAAGNPPGYHDDLATFNAAWNDLVVHQRILAPSPRIEALSAVVLEIVADGATPPRTRFVLAGEALSAITSMIAAQSAHLFRWRAAIDERRALEAYLLHNSETLTEAQRSALLAQAV